MPRLPVHLTTRRMVSDSRHCGIVAAGSASGGESDGDSRCWLNLLGCSRLTPLREHAGTRASRIILKKIPAGSTYSVFLFMPGASFLVPLAVRSRFSRCLVVPFGLLFPLKPSAHGGPTRAQGLPRQKRKRVRAGEQYYFAGARGHPPLAALAIFLWDSSLTRIPNAIFLGGIAYMTVPIGTRLCCTKYSC